MALIATINGKPVYSDKRMRAVTNTRVTFADGSWCDVRTGEVHNVGSGYINIGGTDGGSNAKKVTEGPKRVSASALELRGMAADIQVDVHSSSGIEYTITGPENQVKAIRANVRGGTLVIEGGDSGSSSGNVVISGSSVVIGSGTVMSNVFGRGGMTTVVTGGSGGGENDVKITVKVPRGAAVSSNVNGNVAIGDTNGPLNARVSTSSSVSAGYVTTAQLTASSSGTIRVKRVDGNVTAQASSSGEIRIKDSSISTLMATASSSGSVEVGGTATTAMLNASSSGSVYAAHVQQQPMQNQSSSGRVRVGRVG
jgi:hypothetical protein